jgi:hypothetical protein
MVLKRNKSEKYSAQVKAKVDIIRQQVYKTNAYLG